MVYEYDYDEETQKMRINCLGGLYGDSIEDYSACMATTIDKLMELKKVVRIVFAGVREYEYDFSESKMLLEIALAIERILKERLFSLKNVIIAGCENDAQERYKFLQRLMNDLRFDPIDAYRTLAREIRKIKVKAERESGIKKQCYNHYLNNSLIPIQTILDNCRLIQLAKPNITEHKDRSLYRRIFHPTIRPNFIYTRYISLPPANAELLERYMVGETEIEIYAIPGQVRRLYHIIPPEFRLNEIEYNMLDTARRYLGRHEPRESELEEPERIRENLFRIGLDMLRDLGGEHEIPEKRLEELANILARYTAGLGILDLILQDENIQDIEINSPIGTTPIFIFHGIYQECETNIVPSREDGESWATRFRLKSGRPLDEANPVLDTEIEVPGGRARVAAITRTLSPDGLAFAFRRHRDKPWTLPLFINNKMMDPFSAGLLWFLIDGSRTMLIAGTRSSGKSSLLGALMVQIMPKLRIISVEDSVTGDCQIVYERNGKIEKGTVGKLIDESIENHGCEYDFGREILRGNPENIRVFSMDKNKKFKLSNVSSFIRHKTTKDIYEVTTRTGKKIKVTGDHSLFSLGKDGKIVPAKVRNLKIDDFLVTPRNLKFNETAIGSLDILDYIDYIERGFFIGEPIKKCIIDNWEYIKTQENNRSLRCRWRSLGILPIRFVKHFVKNGYKFGSDIYYKTGSDSNPIPRGAQITKEFMEFLGLWLADGCYDKRSVIISVVDDQSRSCVRDIAKTFNANVKMHSDGISLMINSSSLRALMRALGFTGDAYTKRIPEWIYNLEKEQIAALLRGLFSGDGHVSKSEVMLSLCSKELIQDVQTLLLSYGIIMRIGNFKEIDKTYTARISALSSFQTFRQIGFLQDEKKAKLEILCSKNSTHDSSDVIPFSLETKTLLKSEISGFNSLDYITRDNNIGRQKLLTLCTKVKNSDLAMDMKMLAESDIFWDQIREIRRLESTEEFVYDLSVPECENFVCENILAHNTIELPSAQLRELGYNIQSMKSRSVITNVDTELPAEEALRTALRLGDSALIIGEVRSREALALYEAMRIGALANVVMGTIHGDSAYGVFDRVVNDLGVTPTSFKATDIILIANMLKSPDGLKSFRRCVEMTEVRKRWKTDPGEEGGFVNLLEYSAKDDILKPSKTLLMGESHVLNDIAARVREWKGNWDSVWSNIKLRAKIMATLTDYANVNSRPDLLEAVNVIKSNAHFHIFSNEVKEETGTMDTNLIYERWLAWLRKNYS